NTCYPTLKRCLNAWYCQRGDFFGIYRCHGTRYGASFLSTVPYNHDFSERAYVRLHPDVEGCLTAYTHFLWQITDEAEYQYGVFIRHRDAETSTGICSGTDGSSLDDDVDAGQRRVVFVKYLPGYRDIISKGYFFRQRGDALQVCF